MAQRLTADHVLFSHNIHELRAYTGSPRWPLRRRPVCAGRRAAACRLRVLGMSTMLSTSPSLGAIGWRGHYLSRGYSSERRLSAARLWPTGPLTTPAFLPAGRPPLILRVVHGAARYRATGGARCGVSRSWWLPAQLRRRACQLPDWILNGQAALAGEWTVAFTVRARICAGLPTARPTTRLDRQASDHGPAHPWRASVIEHRAGIRRRHRSVGSIEARVMQLNAPCGRRAQSSGERRTASGSTRGRGAATSSVDRHDLCGTCIGWVVLEGRNILPNGPLRRVQLLQNKAGNIGSTQFKPRFQFSPRLRRPVFTSKFRVVRLDFGPVKTLRIPVGEHVGIPSLDANGAVPKAMSGRRTAEVGRRRVLLELSSHARA